MAGAAIDNALAPNASAASAPRAFDYLNPDLPAGLSRVSMPVIDASPETLEGFGHLVDDRTRCAIEIVRWPAQGWRAVDAGPGEQGGTTEGVFVSEWQGYIRSGRDDAGGCQRNLAFRAEPGARR